MQCSKQNKTFIMKNSYFLPTKSLEGKEVETFARKHQEGKDDARYLCVIIMSYPGSSSEGKKKSDGKLAVFFG